MKNPLNIIVLSLFTAGIGFAGLNNNDAEVMLIDAYADALISQDTTQNKNRRPDSRKRDMGDTSRMRNNGTRMDTVFAPPPPQDTVPIPTPTPGGGRM